MASRHGPVGGADRSAAALRQLGRYTGPATLILSSLAGAPKHGYALTKDIEAFAGTRLPPGTLYEALARLEGQGLIEALESDDRRPLPAHGDRCGSPSRAPRGAAQRR